MRWVSLKELMERRIANKDITYSYQVVGGPFYTLKYDVKTGVLQVTKNILKDPHELQEIEEALKAGPAESLELKVQPTGETIMLGKVTKIKYI